MYNNISGARNVAIGTSTLITNTIGNYNTSVGQYGLQNSRGNNNTAIGYQAGFFTSATDNNTFVGYQAGFANSSDYGNIICLGANTIATGSNQVILGSSGMNIYGGTYNTVSDRRDKADITTMESDFGLNFIKQLRPVNFRYDYRNEYFDPIPIKNEEESEADFNLRYINWKTTNNLESINKDGSKKHTRIHHGFIAQEVGDLGVFGGYQDHTINGGDKLCTLNYNEFIAPLVKSIQELSEICNKLKEDNAALLASQEQYATELELLKQRAF